MSTRDIARAFTLLFCTPVFAAGTTWVVDQGNGAGAHFTAIGPAVAAAQPGDTIRVRAGLYAAVTIEKGVMLIGEPGAVIDTGTGFFVVRDVPLGQRLVMAGFATPPGLGLRMQLQDNLGAVFLEDLRCGSVPQFGDRTAGVWIHDCAFVALNRCRTFGSPAGVAVRSSVLFTDCELYGLSLFKGASRGPGLVLDRSRATVAASRIVGATDPFGVLTTPGIEAFASDTVLTGGSGSAVIGGHVPGVGFLPAVDACGGTIRIDPELALNSGAGAPMIRGDAKLFWQSIPSLSAAGPQPGGAIDLEVWGEPGAVAFVAVSLPGLPRPTPLGDLWLRPGTTLVLGAGTIGPERVWQHTVSTTAGLRAGAVLTLQAGVELPTGTALSTPVSIVAH